MEKPGKTFKRVKKQREEEFTPPHDPSQPFNRQYQKTRMPWQLEVIRKGRWDVLLVYALFWIGAFVVCAIGIYFVIMWCAKVVMPILFPGVIPVIWR
jgi:hypothetical protein